MMQLIEKVMKSLILMQRQKRGQQRNMFRIQPLSIQTLMMMALPFTRCLSDRTLHGKGNRASQIHLDAMTNSHSFGKLSTLFRQTVTMSIHHCMVAEKFG